MSKDVAKETSADVSARPRTIWQRLSGNRGASRTPIAVKIAIGVVVLAVLMVGVVALYANVPAEGEPGVAIDFPNLFFWNRQIFYINII